MMLTKVQLLAELPEKELELLAASLHGRKFAKGTFVLHKGDTRCELLFLLTGTLQVVDYTEQGREVLLHTLQEGEYFGELSVIDGKARSAFVKASSDSVVAFLDKERALKLFYETPLIAKKMLERFAYVIRQSSKQQMMLSNTSAYVRIYMMLLKLLEKSPKVKQGVIDGMPTQQEFAGMVNTSRETVSRAIRYLIKQGVIKKDKRCIIVLKPDKLKGIVFEMSR